MEVEVVGLVVAPVRLLMDKMILLVLVCGVRLSPASDLLDHGGVVQEGDEALGHVRVAHHAVLPVLGAGVGQEEQVEEDKEHHPERADSGLTIGGTGGLSFILIGGRHQTVVTRPVNC